jgi:hypothetical protein
MSYKNFLQKKVDQAREQIQACQCRSNKEVAAEFAARRTELANRFEAARGKADIKWRTKELMALLRGKS